MAESFIGKHDEEPWNDFCAVFTLGKSQAKQTIFSDTDCENVWHGDTFLENTFAQFPQDQRIVRELQNQNSELQIQNSELQIQNSELQIQYAILVGSKSWRITKPLRRAFGIFRK